MLLGLASCGEPYDNEANRAEWAAIAAEPAFCRADNIPVGLWRYTTIVEGTGYSSPATAVTFHLANEVLGLKGTSFDSYVQKNVIAHVFREERPGQGWADRYGTLIRRLPSNLREGYVLRRQDRDLPGFDAYQSPGNQGLDYIATDRSAFFRCFDYVDRVSFPNPFCQGYLFAASGVQPTYVKFSADAAGELPAIHAAVLDLSRRIAEGCRTASGYPNPVRKPASAGSSVLPG